MLSRYNGSKWRWAIGTGRQVLKAAGTGVARFIDEYGRGTGTGAQDMRTGLGFLPCVDHRGCKSNAVPAVCLQSERWDCELDSIHVARFFVGCWWFCP